MTIKAKLLFQYISKSKKGTIKAHSGTITAKILIFKKKSTLPESTNKPSQKAGNRFFFHFFKQNVTHFLKFKKAPSKRKT